MAVPYSFVSLLAKRCRTAVKPPLPSDCARLTPYIDPARSDPRLELLARLQNIYWVFDFDLGRMHWANAAALAMWKAESLQELRARDYSVSESSAIAARLRQFQLDFRRRDAVFIEPWTFYPRGQARTLNVAHRGFVLPDGRMAMLLEVLGDVQFPSEEAQRSADAVVHTSVMISQFDRRGRPLYRNPAARAAVDDSSRRLGEHFVELADYRTLRRSVRANGQARAVCRVRTVLGERWHELSVKSCLDSVSGKSVLLISEVDVGELKRAEAQAHFLSRHDVLTGLPNRQVVLSDFERFLSEMHRQGQEVALLFIDLDNFKTVNDSLGHQAGDTLLVEIAHRLRTVVREHDQVARLGGDEFLVLTSAPRIHAHVRALTDRLIAALSQEVDLHGLAVRVTPSVGVCVARPDGKLGIHDLMQHADVAMYRAKAQGRNRAVFFSPDMQDAVRYRLHLETDLRRALKAGEFELFYQPRVEVGGEGRIVGVEALVRWRHPERGLVLPGEFITLCEETGMIVPLGAQLLEQAAMQQAQWQHRGLKLLMSVNLSPRQFVDGDLLATARRALEVSGCEPGQIELEITESVLVGNDGQTQEILQELNALGFRIAVDDFGTGYSNLAYLQRYPIHCLKIDRTFIAGLGSASPIAQLIVTLCRMLKVDCVAEGVETGAQLEWLRRNRVGQYQGYLFSPPLSAAEFEALSLQASPSA